MKKEGLQMCWPKHFMLTEKARLKYMLDISMFNIDK